MKKSNKIKKEKEHMSDHYISFMAIEIKLKNFLSAIDIPEKITVEDMKDIIWNDTDTKLTSRLANVLLGETLKEDFQKGLDIIMEAWNYFPHRSLNGLSPNEMVERSKNKDKDRENENFPLEYRRNFFEVFGKRFPQETRVVKRGKKEWEFEYPVEIQEFANFKTDLEELDQNYGEELCEDSLLIKNRKLIVSMIERVSNEQPLFFNGAIIMANEAFKNGEAKRAKQILERSIEAGRKLLSKDFLFNKNILPWAMLDNRPFLSLLAEYATLVEAVDGPLAAIPLYEELIALNPNDNQGMRSLLATAYLKTSRLEEICELVKKFPNDAVQELVVGHILALYKLGRNDEMKKAIKNASKHSGHVFKEILKSSHLPPELIPGRMRVGGDDEAWIYWHEQGNMWMTSPGAREFLQENL